MKTATLVVRILLGLIMLVFGLNNILGFLHMPMPTGDAGTFLMLLVAHKYMTFVAVLQIIGGLLLLVGRFVPLGLTILGPIIVNILLFHLLMDPSGIPLALVAVVLELFLLWAYRLSFAGLFTADAVVA
jgi:putative oxidoreductase